MKFSECISELTVLWIDWVRHNAEVFNSTLSVSEQRYHAEQCEKLINRRYELMELMDEYFQKTTN